jgi:hypothetical protein
MPRLRPRQQGPGHPGDPGRLAGQSVDHQHRGLHRAGAEHVVVRTDFKANERKADAQQRPFRACPTIFLRARNVDRSPRLKGGVPITKGNTNEDSPIDCYNPLTAIIALVSASSAFAQGSPNQPAPNPSATQALSLSPSNRSDSRSKMTFLRPAIRTLKLCRSLFSFAQRTREATQ